MVLAGVTLMPVTTTGASGSGDFLKAIRVVECGDVANPPKGDGGNARGHYQIWYAYWYDAVEFSSVGGAYADCDKRDYAGKVVGAYMTRYAKAEWARAVVGTATMADLEKLARIHNGGPKGHTKDATDPYWKKVKKELAK